ncbi:Gfo/Idh/MocA family protein [Thermogemmatispora sp.]|uniref:Gfo/Idh/MocA family protein n=1 Tax=Thermogemmatispora sp. TaxID=1968838 RepID=UPI0035E43559
MSALRLALLGCGFWARYQLAAWLELADVQVVALYNRTRSKAEALAARFGVPAIYDDAEQLLERECPDAVDIVTDPATHAHFVELAARYGVAAICQKPMAPTLEEAERMVALSAAAGIPLIIHENWRWQRPLRQLKQELLAGNIGRPFRARLQFCCSFPVFANQPFLKEVERFILMDVGSHLLDTARFLFGEAQSLSCQTARVNPEIKGEDVATVMLRMGEVTCLCELSYASRLEHERFPETYVLIEGSEGSLELGPDYWIRRTTSEGTLARRYPPPRYPWADPAYELVQASIVPCNANILADLRGGPPAETRADDNLKTMRLVFAAYEAASTGCTVHLS